MTNCPTNIQIQDITLTKMQFESLKSILSQVEWAIFLESADNDHVDSHWSILSIAPIATLQSTSGVCTYQQGQLCEQHNTDPFTLMNEKRLALFNHPSSNEHFPFLGGLLGVINYELGYQFEDIKHAQQPKTLALPELSIGFYDWALLYNHKADRFYLVTQQTALSTLSAQAQWQQRYAWLMEKTVSADKLMPFSLCGEWQANMTKQQYSQKFNKIQDYILSGDCYQVNLAQRFTATYQGDEYQAYQALLADNSPPFAAFMRLPEQSILSLSPERFLKLDNGIVQSKPIKGTRPRFQDPILDKDSRLQLLASEKDRSENLMIVDLLRNDIGRVCLPGSVKVPSLFEVESFPAVHHLVSTVKGHLAKPHQVEDLLRACFPGGSITGAPKIRSMEIIAELEPDRRQSYCGSIGYINGNGEMDMNIAIRTLICVEGQIYCWAGGGLVADSQVDAEYQECFDKVSKILPCLQALNTNG
jgi:para-aminobenzoate synthetase component 1